MGDPRKQHKSYKTPNHPWQKARIESDKLLIRAYGLKNKKEIWKMDSKLESFKDQLRGAIADHEVQRKKERANTIKKIESLGLITPGAGEDDVLGLKVDDIMERRLQTVIFRKGLARSPKQARQFITHGHITVDGKPITAPAFLLTKKEEATVKFISGSTLDNSEHPERVPIIKKEKKRSAPDDRSKGRGFKRPSRKPVVQKKRGK